MPFRLIVLPLPEQQLYELSRLLPVKYRKVLKTLGLIESDPRYPGLRSHRYEDLEGAFGHKIWESYVENHTPGAYRVFWHYGPDDGEIPIVAITPHP